ncbi:hypothetical protein GOFOIKOB_6419 [Methylobacterium tardum]|uniref:Uncharacterized protein n=1 Tax=Methylobacterium tardum TaxID=374432 RepID=A0AA37TK42_9HYPH|nr:hypothetical protein [Methylobacterium tardum]GJE53340.1 hypothetical protein GOFOIKOB_6419 [Methylobacterium tardum]GLS74660.1 hypothetical protein GCM10007890_66780 [Methylobacterium tardum]
MTLRTSLRRLIGRDPVRPTLRERATETAARLAASKAPAAKPASPSATAQVLHPAGEPDPALAVATVFRASWDALSKVLDAEAPDDLVGELEDAQGAAYDRLRAVRPSTPEGYRALVECWGTVLKGHRGAEPGMTAADHAADALIAAAGACAPVQPVDWYDPPPGFMASPALEPSNFVPVSDGIARELARLRGAAWAEFHRRVSPGTEAEDIRRIRRELHLDKLSPELPHSNIVDQVDFASADIRELQALHGRMRELSSVAYAMSVMECCADNAAGRLLHWLADELTTVESKAADELQSRQPTDFWDRRTRLAAVAERIIDNGDNAETAGFIQELTAWAAEQARR